MDRIKELQAVYRDTLLDDVMPFWGRHSHDRVHGGYFTCLLRDGQVFDTDKFVWLQGRQAWTYAMLYQRVAPREEWLEGAKLGVDFLKKYGRDRDGNFYFSLTREGAPLVQAYNVFSDCFAAMAFSQYGLAAGDEESLDLAKRTFSNILIRQKNPKGVYNKAFPGTRPLKGFSLPMILSNLCLELEPLLSPDLVAETLAHCEHEVMEVFLDKKELLVYENLHTDGSKSDSFEGRLINPGHGIEAMWFMMDLAARRGDRTLIKRAVDVTIRLIEYGWDDEFEGIFYFKDVKGYPPQQLEWDQKLWWVHLETLVALAKGYQLTGDHRCAEWFLRVHNYSWEHFADPSHGEWFGYLDRRGNPLLMLKGGKWKGCFHVPRAMYQVWKTLEKSGEG
ncbi:N-acylglucosamine 2-epimerase [Lunatimonas lonarensis]|uniref:N-acylglucosamine 2-epimerase n=1 Tax=Lunatimonas lonarensis TaxID=1232681 RepID=R7ZY16_9BACT|nr:AGE family epimerase/isomerase [Lunatimonas lonarensis]EON79040.1 N-acylglucosamine 2-epimerase [Lunatimonas lonarensis]